MKGTMLNRLLYIHLLLLLAIRLHAQEYFFKNITVDNGLSHNLVFCTLQDAYGFIWFGTKDGLNRYDGYKIRTFRGDPRINGSLGNNDVRALLNRSKNEIWVGTKKGLFMYDVLKERFREVDQFRNAYISAIVPDQENNIWLIANHSLYRIARHDTTIFRELQGIATSVCALANGDIWIGTTNGKLARYAGSQWHFTELFDKHFLPARWIEKLCEGNNHELLVGTASAGLLSYDPASGTIRKILSYDNNERPVYVRDIIRNGNDYWIATESGIYIYDGSQRIKSHLKKDANVKNGLADNAIYTLLKDNTGNIWAGSYFKGVNMFPNQDFLFNSMPPGFTFSSAAEAPEFRNSIVREICQDRYQSLWVGTEDNGLYQFNHTSKKIIHYRSSSQSSSLSYNNIHGLLCTGDTLWLGTFERGMDLLNIRTGKVFRHYDIKSGVNLKSNFVITFCQARDGTVYVGTAGGLQQFDARNKQFVTVGPVPGDFIYSIIEDRSGKIWIGTEDSGVWSYDPVTGTAAPLRHTRVTEPSVNVKTNSIYEDMQGNIWIATEGDGLLVYDRNRQLQTHYTTANGLPSNFVYKIVQGDPSNMWVSTALGLVHLNTVSKSTRVFTRENGLPSNQFNYNSGFKDSRGTVYFGTTSGLACFSPAYTQSVRFKIPLYFTGLKIFDKEALIAAAHSPLKTSLLNTEALVLSHKQSTFNIDFSGLVYAAQNDIRYAYKLKGLNDEWAQLKESRSIYFTQLPPGKYTLEVQATAPFSGRFSGADIQLDITVLPPFWKSRTAYLLYTIAAILLFLGILRYYHRHQKRLQAQKIEELNRQKELENNQAKIDFFTNIAHEIKTPLTLIQGPVEDLLSRSEHAPDNYELTLIEKNTTRLLQLTNQLLDFRRIESNHITVTVSSINLSALVSEVFTNFKMAADVKNLRYTLQVPSGPVLIQSDEDLLMKILYNLFSNGIKYGDSRLSITLHQPIAQSVRIEFVNDGELIPEAAMDKIFQPFYRFNKNEIKEGTGIGLSIAHSLTRMLNGTLTAAVAEGHNHFTLLLPVK